MALSVRQQGEVAYLRGVLGLDQIEERLAKLESEEVKPWTLEEAHSHGLANIARLEVSPVTPYSPEGDPDPEPEEGEEKEEWVPAGSVDQEETVRESSPASEDVSYEDEEDLDLDALLEEKEDYNEWTVNELKAELSRRGQPVSGTKAELIDRLEQGDNDVRQ